MIVSVSLLPDASRLTEETDVAIVIDVLRATSVMARALSAGASRITTCREIDQARQLAASSDPPALLCGERACKKIDGFDLGNSPSEYSEARVAGIPLVMTTTNGTRAIEAAANVSRVFTASFLNLEAVLDAIAQVNTLHLVCAGTDGEVTAEDVSLAGAIVSRCETRFGAILGNDEAILARQLWKSWFPQKQQAPNARKAQAAQQVQLGDHLKETRGGRNLARVGYEQDLILCSEMDAVSVVPERVSLSPAVFEPAIFQCKQ